MIQATCPSCGKQYSLPDQAAGKKAKCKDCGAVMPIPAAGKAAKPPSKKKRKPADDDPLGLGGAPERATDLSSLYGGTGGDPVASPGSEPAGFNPSVSFSNTPARKSASPLPMGLILGVGGGAAALILIVVVAVVMLGGGGKDDADTGTGGLSITGGTVPGASSPATDNDDDDNTDTDDDDSTSGTRVDPNLTRYGAKAIQTPPDADLKPWTLAKSVDDDSSFHQRVAFRGLAFIVPNDWSVELTEAKQMFGADLIAGDAPSRAKRKFDELRILNIGSAPFTTLSVYVSPRHAKTPWPDLYWVERTTGDMVIDPDLAQFAKKNKDNFETPNAKIVNVLDKLLNTSPLRANRSVGYDWLEPKAFFVNRTQVDDVSFGELFGGYRFARIDGRDLLDEYRTVTYAGYVGDTLVTAQIQYQKEAPANLGPIEQVLREARLIKQEEAEALAESDPVFRRWLRSNTTTLAFNTTPAPLSGQVSIGDPLDPVGVPQTPGLVGPRGKGFGIELPDDLEVISTTRAAIRTEPLADGTWLSMEVHKLAGLERRQDAPWIEGGASILMRGRHEALPPGVERSELEAQDVTVHRLLYPQVPGQPTRRVAYVAKQGAFLITLFGYVPTDNPERLAAFDAAAQTIQPMVEAPPDDFAPDDEVETEDETEQEDARR